MSTMSSGDIEGGSIEMDDVNVLVGRQPGEVASGDLGDGSMSFKSMFKSILKTYDNERKWWVAMEDFMKKNKDFEAKVNCSSVFWHAQKFCIYLSCR